MICILKDRPKFIREKSGFCKYSHILEIIFTRKISISSIKSVCYAHNYIVTRLQKIMVSDQKYIDNTCGYYCTLWQKATYNYT